MMKPKSTKPKISIKPTVVDRFLEAVGVTLLLVIWVFVLWYYPTLPQRIPTHFGPDGIPDRFGSKPSLFLLPITATVLSAFMFVGAYFPHRGNYPVKVTEENAPRLYRYCASLLREMGVGCNVLFLWLVAGTCRIAMNQANGLGSWFLLCMVVIVAPIVYYLIRMMMAR